MSATPPASPSSPSMRFIALMTPAIQSIVNGSPRKPSWMGSPKGFAISSMRKPSAYISAGDRELDEELVLRVRALEVVETPSAAMASPPAKSPNGAPRIRVEARADVAVTKSSADERREERDDDGDAAEPRDRLPVDLARRERVVERPHRCASARTTGVRTAARPLRRRMLRRGLHGYFTAVRPGVDAGGAKKPRATLTNRPPGRSSGAKTECNGCSRTMRTGYQHLARRRLTVPAAWVYRAQFPRPVFG